MIKHIETLALAFCVVQVALFMIEEWAWRDSRLDFFCMILKTIIISVYLYKLM